MWRNKQRRFDFLTHLCVQVRASVTIKTHNIINNNIDRPSERSCKVWDITFWHVSPFHYYSNFQVPKCSCPKCLMGLQSWIGKTFFDIDTYLIHLYHTTWHLSTYGSLLCAFILSKKFPMREICQTSWHQNLNKLKWEVFQCFAITNLAVVTKKIIRLLKTIFCPELSNIINKDNCGLDWRF